jgi:hypothetical protein
MPADYRGGARTRISAWRAAERHELARRQYALSISHDTPTTDSDSLTCLLETADGRRAIGRLAATTRVALPRARAMRFLRRVVGARNLGDGGGGYYTELGRCRRFGAHRLDCQTIETTYENESRTRACAGVISAKLRPDGVRASDRRGRHACRRLG